MPLKGKTMIYTVQQLIDALKELPPNAAVHVWSDGDRYIIQDVDNWDDEHIHLNLQFIPQPDV